MRALVQTRYGSADLLELKEVPKPVPADDEVLIKVHAASVNGSDKEALIGKPAYARMGGIRGILGSDIAGRVEAVGRNTREYQPGDDVFGEIPTYSGGFAEYACAPERTLVRKPASLSFEQAAAIPQAGTIAWRGICVKGDVQAGKKVLINGAGGSAGVFAVQLAKLRGAEVTGVDRTDKLDFLRALGADHVIDYTREDFTRTGQQYDLILDVIAHRGAFAFARALRPNGTCFVVGGPVRVLLPLAMMGPVIRRATGKKIGLLVALQNRDDLIAITELCEAGKVVPVIDRRFPLSEAREALRYVVEGRHKGKVVITIAG